MRAVLQRVSTAAVAVGGRTVAQIGAGVLALVAIGRDDTEAVLAPFVEKVATLRLFPDGKGHFSRSLVDTGGDLLLVSQFTLYGDVRRGRRPEFTAAAPAEPAARLLDDLAARFRARGIPTQCGQFGAYMQVSLVNDGPVTLILDL